MRQGTPSREIYYVKSNQKKPEVAALTSDKIDLRCIEEYFIMIKGSPHQEEDIKA